MTAPSIDWPGLVMDTIRTPQDAAERIMGWNLGRGFLYQALAAMVALNTILAGLSHYLNPTPIGVAVGLDNPIASFLVGAGSVVIAVHLFFWAGRATGAQGQFSDLLALFVWFQAIRFLGQLASLLAYMLVPALGLFVALAVGIFSIWLITHFINTGLRLNSFLHAVGLLIAVPVGIMLGLTLLITLIGATNLGMVPNV